MPKPRKETAADIMLSVKKPSPVEVVVFMRSESQFKTKLLKVCTINVDIHTRESMIVGLCIAVQIFTIPDSQFLACIEVAKPWVREHQLWGIHSITRKVIPSACSKAHQSLERIDALVPCI